MDVVDKLGDIFRNLQEDCKELGTGGRPNHSCNKCLRRWEEIGGSSVYKQETADVCRFAVPVFMISNRIDDENWVYAVFQCLKERAFSLGRVQFNCQILLNPIFFFFFSFLVSLM